MALVPAPSGSGEGNSILPPKRPNSSKYWFFTFNNYNVAVIGSLVSEFQVKCEWYVFQEETGKSGTPHLQGTIALKSKGRPLETFSFKGIHWEKTKAIKSAIDYCTKLDSRTGEIYTNIVVPKPLKLLNYTDMYPWQAKIVDLVTGEPDDRTINWFYETKGCTGKTVLAKYICAKHNALLISGKSADCKFAVVDFHKAQKRWPEIIIMNVPRINHDFINYEALESIKDGAFFSGKYESGMAIFNSPHIIVFANELPNLTAMSRDRWLITQITDTGIPVSANLKTESRECVHTT